MEKHDQVSILGSKAKEFIESTTIKVLGKDL
jgi:hypothetical protein